MKKLIGAALIGSLLIGCTSVAPSRGLSAYQGVELEPAEYGAQYVAGVVFNKPRHSKSGRDISFCVAQFVSNKDISITDQSRSFFGQYTGNYYQFNNDRTISGGSVISHVSHDGTAMIANGMTGYRASYFGSPVDRVVRFKLTAEPIATGYRYRFSEIETVQLTTGVLHNSGFERLYAHEGARPEQALQELKRLADNIDGCL